jgi:alpha-tubulin suppressor-like RCC1 family protein
LTGAVAIAAGTQFTCALLSGGAVDCWGSGDFGQLGDGMLGGSDACHGAPNSCFMTPASIPTLTGLEAISAGDDFACAVLPCGNVECWGENVFGNLGNGSAAGPDTCPYSGSTVACSTLPVHVAGLGCPDGQTCSAGACR